MANGTSRVYKHSRPSLVVECTGGRNLGNCYNASYYRITSLQALGRDQIMALREAGFLGYGQEFSFTYKNADGSRGAVPDKVDWKIKVEPTASDTVQCVEVDDRTGEVLRTPSINPYTGEPDGTTEISYFVYECESRVDSGD